MKRIWVVENAVPVSNLPYIPPFLDKLGIQHLLNNEESEWEEEPVRQLCEHFCTDDYELTVLASPPSFEKHLQLGLAPPHIVIFDWEFPTLNMQANIAAIDKALRSTFTYVQVYTHLGAEAVEPHLGELRERYGSRLLPTRAKNEVTPEALHTYLADAWKNTIAGETADAVRDRARTAVERMLIDLCLVPKSALAAIAEGNVDQFVSVVMAKLRDELGATGLDDLAKFLKAGGNAAAAADVRRLESTFYYYFPQDDLVRTGDIIVNESGEYAMVITPWCNLDKFQKKTGGYLTVVNACEMTANAFTVAGIAKDKIGNSATASHNAASHSIIPLPNVPKKANDRTSLIDLALITHSWNTLRIKDVQGPLLYSALTSKRVCTLTETFGGAVVSHLAKTISALGVPDFPGFEIDRLSKAIKP